MREVMCMEKHMKLFQFKSMHVWFPEDDYHCQSLCDLIRLYGYRHIHKGFHAYLVEKTICIDLSQPVEEIFAAFKRQYRQQIKKSATDGFETCFFDSASINRDRDVLNDIMQIYQGMHHDKGIDRCLDINELTQYVDGGLLWISLIKHEKIPIVYHLLISDHQSVHVGYSCSLFRRQDPQMQQIIGRANKKLHWDEMQYFKQLGAVCYDMGGIFADNSTDPGINQFKMGFGGQCKACFSELKACSAIAHLYLLLCKLLNKKIL